MYFFYTHGCFIFKINSISMAICEGVFYCATVLVQFLLKRIEVD